MTHTLIVPARENTACDFQSASQTIETVIVQKHVSQNVTMFSK